eukprot:TRINITY_DN3844_c0_g1_i1.p1 TRINITY_DN3844_c0_g1~~TRINITY_DN3844_c0_g1_i1.p1  ORF type:complete len:216 (-),score=25.20 TRINITY_DN3844_c0_g1_i1:140-787(-)
MDEHQALLQPAQAEGEPSSEDSDADRGCLEMDLACGCCSLDQGLKVLLLLLVIEGVMMSMSVSSIGPLTVPSFGFGVLMLALALYGYWGIASRDLKKLTIVGIGLWLVLLICAGLTTGRLLIADQYCEGQTCFENNNNGVFTEVPCDAQRTSPAVPTHSCPGESSNHDACVHNHYLNAILCASAILPTALGAVCVVRSMVFKLERGGQHLSLIHI